MKKLLLSMMAFAALYSAEAKKVKFQVDMTGQTVSANGVHVAGDFQAAAGFPGDWSPSTTALSNGGSGNIYSLVVDIPAKTFYRFKYINGNTWNEVEGVPAINQKGHINNGKSDDNRWYYIDSTANDTTIIPAIKYAGTAPSGMYAIRFAVDMKNETVNANGVHIAGAIQGWNPAGTNMANLFGADEPSNKVYEYIAYVAAGSYQYKYLNGNDWPFVESVPGACGVAPDGNREVVVTASDVVATKVCFSSCSSCPAAPIPSYNVTFRIDMTNSVCDGGYDSVTVAGAKIKNSLGQNWGDGAQKMLDGDNNKVFEITLSIDSGDCEFKYRLHKNGGTAWEGIANRIIALTSDSTLAINCFNTTSACSPLPAASDITFKVDITDTIPGVLFVIGTFQTPNWQAGAVRMLPSPGQPGIFQVTVNDVCPGSFSYKFVNAYDGDSSKTQWEETFPYDSLRGCTQPSGVGGYNRVYTRLNADPVTLFYKFNSCVAGANVGINELALNSTFKLYPNPAQSHTTMEFNDKSTSHDVVVMDITGRTIQSYSDYKQNTLLINTDEMSKGIYFIKASNTRNESVTSKLIVR